MAEKLIAIATGKSTSLKDSKFIEFIKKYQNSIIKIKKYRDSFSKFFDESINDNYLTLRTRSRLISKSYMMTSGLVDAVSEHRLYLCTVDYYPELYTKFEFKDEEEFKNDLFNLYNLK